MRMRSAAAYQLATNISIFSLFLRLHVLHVKYVHSIITANTCCQDEWIQKARGPSGKSKVLVASSRSRSSISSPSALCFAAVAHHGESRSSRSYANEPRGDWPSVAKKKKKPPIDDRKISKRRNQETQQLSTA